MDTIVLTKNDVRFYIDFTVKDSEGVAVNLTGAVVNFQLADRNYENRVDGACTITDAPNGRCRYTFAYGDLDLEPGNYFGALQYTLTTVSDTSVPIPATPRDEVTIFTVADHGLVEGDDVVFSLIEQAGWTILNGNTYRITKISDSEFSIDVDSSGFAADYLAADPGIYKKSTDKVVSSSQFLVKMVEECG